MSAQITQKRPLHLFEGNGVEIEYMIVDDPSLELVPASDRVLKDQNGQIANEISRDGMAWSNELVLHVIEIKTDGPVESLSGLGSVFQEQVADIEKILKAFSARLMPGALHP